MEKLLSEKSNGKKPLAEVVDLPQRADVASRSGEMLANTGATKSKSFDMEKAALVHGRNQSLLLI